MLITTILTFFVLRYAWHYNLLLCVASTIFFLVIDAAFFSANLIKLVEGGWFPLTMGALIFTIMVTWRRGREILYGRLRRAAISLGPFLDSLFQDPPHRVPGTAIFLIGDPNAVPHAFLHNLAHNKVIHERIVFLTVVFKDIPWVPASERVTVEPLGHDCYESNSTSAS